MGLWEDRDRAQSELVGTVLMVSITIIGAVLTVALAGAALQAISDESQDSLTRDSFHEMDDRLSGLYNSEVSSETTLRFPEGSGSDLSFNESEGSVEITVETVDEYRNLTEKNVTRYEQDLGAVVYKSSDGEKLVYQGGGFWEYPSPSYAVVRSNPPLSRAGEFLTFQFATLKGNRGINEGNELVARRNVADSTQRSEEIRNELSPAWNIKNTEYTVPVDITVTIESKYALGWATYAEEELSDVTVSPKPADMDADDTEVTLTFEDTGTTDFLTYPDPIVYVGPASEAPRGFDPRANSSIERTGENSFNISGQDVNANQGQQLAFYDESREEWVIHTQNNNDLTPPSGNGEWKNVTEISNSIEGGPSSRAAPRWDDSEDPPQIESYKKSGSDSEEYTFNSSYADTRICVVAYTDDRIGSQVDGVFEQLETCASNLENSERYMPTDLDINLTQDDYESVVGERQTVEVEVENVGAVESTRGHAVGLFVEDDDGNVRVADFRTNESISNGDIDTGETVSVTMNWTAASENETKLYARVGNQDIDEANLSIEARNTDLSVDINETETPDEVAPGTEAQVNATISNNGNAPVLDTKVSLLNGDGVPVNVVEIDRLDAAGPGSDNVTDVTLSWIAPVSDFDEELEVQALDANDTHRIKAEGTPEFQVDITGTDDAAGEGKPFNVTVDVTNSGDGGGKQQILLVADTETTDGLIVDAREVFVGEGNDTTVTMVWDSPVELERGDNKVRVRSPDDSDTTPFDTQAKFEVTDIDAPDDIDEGDLDKEVSVTATINNTGDVAGTPTADLEPAADSALDIENSSVTAATIAGNESEDVTFDVTVRNGSLTGELAVSTRDDEATERIVVVRDGPDCSDVDYDTDSDGYLLIETVDQLQCIEQEGLDKNYRLENDIDAYGTEHWNGGDGFDPIGEEGAGSAGGNAFGGTFDGQGYKIEGLTIDRYNTAFVGLFAITDKFSGPDDLGEGSTVESVELVDVDVRGMTVVGGVAGGGGGTFRNISVSGHVESKYQQVGGIVGHGHDADLTNQLVSTATVTGNEPIVVGDHSDKHPWQDSEGSPNLGIGGILGGMGYDTEFSVGYSRANVSGPSSVGGIAGWTSNNPSDLSQMYWADGDLSLEGDIGALFDDDDIGREQFTVPLQVGGIAGRIGETSGTEDTIYNSVYSDGPTVGDGGDNVNDNSIDLDADEMTGPQVLPDDKPESWYDQYPGVTKEDAEGTMANLDWDIWEPVYDIDPKTGNITNEGFPIFAWQSEGGFIVESVEAPDNVTEGDSVTVNATIDNTQDIDETQRIVLRDPEGNPVDSTELALDGNENATVELDWQTRPGDNTSNLTESEITVSTEDFGKTDPLDVRKLEDSEFLIEDASAAPKKVDELDDVEFTATITNDGIGANQTVFLQDENGTILNYTHLYLGEQQSEDITLRWETTYGDADSDDRNITLRTVADASSFNITVNKSEGPDFQVEPIEFPTGQGDRVAAGRPLTVQVNITNRGPVEDTQFVSLMPSGSDQILALEDITLGPGDSKEFSLTWDPANNPTVDEIEVSTRDDSETRSVDIWQPQLDPTTNPIDTSVNIFDLA
ncbi:DUF7289 family protein [Haloarcula salinisoli]|uniref:CARDB domain-containing protein n=1 Tax=Haloarcula salinisoli TaxID=2487746 RepID=A0A8J8C7U1_9EURY|nr:CARDB domain-containing protein [Halomicroarcula salinisoli]MBX0303657.1 hypothetical protein [Halomicroarcula salinisoli]